MSFFFRTNVAAVLLASLSLPAYAVECASLDDCMMRGSSAATPAEAVQFYDRGIGFWQKSDGETLLGRAQLMRAQTRIQLYVQGQGRDKSLLDAAEKDARDAARLTPDNYLAPAAVAIVLANRGDNAGAEEWMAKVVAAGAGNPLAWFERGNYLLARGDNGRAVADFDKAISLLSMRLFDKEKGLYTMRTGVDLPPPQRVRIYVQRALAHARLNNQPAADADMAQACALGEKRACR